MSRFFLVREFDPVVDALRDRRASFTEREALDARFWSVGDDAALREDLRFRPTFGDRWILAEHLLANDIAYATLVAQGGGSLSLDAHFPQWDARYQSHTVLCAADDRLVIHGGAVRLAASQLGDRPRLVDATPLEQWVTHLPFYSLRAVAASMPAGGWDPRALDEQLPTLLGWLRVDLPQLTDRRLFVARLDGHSMDDGANGLRDRSLAVFRAGEVDVDARPVVVVRGAYRDPDTAGYVVKRLVRDGDRVRLVSSNPDRVRYPEITLDPSRAAELSVVAELVRPIPTEHYDRELRVERTPGTRPLASRTYHAEVQGRLEAKLDRVFGPPPPRDAPPVAPWGAWTAALGLDGASLSVKLSALTGLPDDAGAVTVSGAPRTSAKRAANARLHPSVIPVSPQTEDFVPCAEGVTGPAAEALAACAVRGLDAARASVFARRGDELWFRRDVPRVRAGETVRLVLPPTMRVDPRSDRVASPLDVGWSWIEWTLADAPSPDDRVQLEALGVRVDPAPLTLGFTGSPPRRITVGPRGEEIAQWRPGDVVRVTVRATGPGGVGEARLFALGPRGIASIALSNTDPCTVALDALVAGRYALRAEAQETTVSPVERFFEVRDDVDGAWPSATATLEGVTTGEPTDLSTALGTVTLRAPPFWPVRAQWVDGAPLRLEPVCADALGEVDLAPWRATLAGGLASARAAKLTLRAGVLASWSLAHRRIPTSEAVRDALRTMWAQLGPAVESSDGIPAALFDAWLRPVLRELGWSVPPAWNPALAKDDVAAVAIRSADGVRARLVALPAPRWDESPWTALAERLSDGDTSDLVVSDGVRWRSYKRRRRWFVAHSIAKALAEDHAWQLFLQEFDTA